jgi:hypothetical protein
MVSPPTCDANSATEQLVPLQYVVSVTSASPLARTIESALPPKSLPIPHFVSSFYWKSQLVRQYADLPPVMRFVRNHVGDHRGAARPRLSPTIPPKLFHASIRVCQSFGYHFRATSGAFRQRSASLALCATHVVELHRQLKVRRREPYPLATNIVHMCENRRDSAASRSFGARWVAAPGPRIKLLEK